MARKLKARARKLMRESIEDELALQVAYYERKDAEIEAGNFNVYAPGPAPDVRVKTLKRLLRDLKIAEQQEETAHARR